MIRKRVIFMIIVFIILIIIGVLWKKYWIPEKYSVTAEEFSLYNNYILVKEAYHTGTGWEIVGDENGYYDSKEIKDIIIEGEKLPISKMGHNINTFMCVVEYSGLKKHVAFDEQIESYVVTEWHPVYPVVRNSVLPQWLLPKSFMNRNDLIIY